MSRETTTNEGEDPARDFNFRGNLDRSRRMAEANRQRYSIYSGLMSGAQVPAGYIGHLAGISLIPTVDAPTRLHPSSRLNIHLEDGAVGVIDGFPQRGRGEPPESALAVAYNVPGFLSVREMREAMRRAAYQGDSDDSESEEASEVATAGETKDFSYTSRPSVAPRKLQATRAPTSADRPVVAGGAGVAAGRTGHRAARTSIDLGINEGLGNEGRSRRVTPLVWGEIPAPTRTRDHPEGVPTPAGPVPGGRQEPGGAVGNAKAEGSSRIPHPMVTPRPYASGTPNLTLPDRPPAAVTVNVAAQWGRGQPTDISAVMQVRGSHLSKLEREGARTAEMRFSRATGDCGQIIRRDQEGLEKHPQNGSQNFGDRNFSSHTVRKRDREENYEGPRNPGHGFNDKPLAPELQTQPEKRRRFNKAGTSPDVPAPPVASNKEDEKATNTESNVTPSNERHSITNLGVNANPFGGSAAALGTTANNASTIEFAQSEQLPFDLIADYPFQTIPWPDIYRPWGEWPPRETSVSSHFTFEFDYDNCARLEPAWDSDDA
ncbi:hypothetical protein GLOTRDRAFT_129386 [Gloeophyllum trabeum ATCC 11539]|uniref:Uncharacterized protein n=1 Tax=Gloeophyllum trabeum (strain ATCC 11539 / FP-39264 / Madison 617) TaxID=670483 RepID=S7RL50_GLOTA|nr:uncharacterized protein GLOTRDRAFT_129386 [Gloeophyllum trabeum ATCC 11539]EPQ55095.1 hypothetical protein GLOTRDRAFT_129386 [Gloeophyllum trabeum ATCC 11539]